MYKNPRNTKLYKNLNPYSACEMAENWNNEELSQKTLQVVWQYIYDTKLYLQLQGWYGRTVRDLLEDGLIRR